MNKTEAVNIFQKILHEYQVIKTPKYRHAEYNDIIEKYKELHGIKEHLQGNKIYHDLVNGISQTLSKLKKDKILKELSRDEIWSNYSERGMNKTIRPSPKNKYNKDNFPIKWIIKGKYEGALTNGYWDENNFKIMEILGYALLMNIGDDSLPKNPEPIFDNLKSIEKRELQLNGNIQETQNNKIAVTTNIAKRTTFSIGIDDSYFRKATGLKISSTEIFNLLLETSRAEFKLPFPVIVKDNKGKESMHQMTYFSRFFELGEEKIKVRKDGVVQLRKYRINFSTLLGELFVNNLKSMFNDRVDLKFYSLPKPAQTFYRRFLLTN
ncbi:MAG: hypothetical protein KAR45_16520, partial [Desulfobacteraceae bacterium]|nr:hypothetical protein [Desulfobacteraceae bacterium]